MKKVPLRPISEKRAKQLREKKQRAYSTLQRHSQVKKFRSKPRRGELTPEQKYEIRQAVYDRAGGKCEITVGGKRCGKFAPWVGDDFTRGHLVHLKSRGSGGEWSKRNCLWGCREHHMDYLHNASGHPCPRKDGTRDIPLPQSKWNQPTESHTF